MPSYRFKKQTQADADYLSSVLQGLEGGLSSDGLSYEFKFEEDNLAIFRVNSNTGEITQSYIPTTGNPISDFESDILGTLKVVDAASKGGKRRRGRKTRTRKSVRHTRRSKSRRFIFDV
jgi:hypothetical protein